MACHDCRSECRKFGKRRNGLRRYQCKQCRKTFTEPHQKPLDDMYTSIERAEMVLRLLLEGNSVSSVERLTGIEGRITAFTNEVTPPLNQALESNAQEREITIKQGSIMDIVI